MAVLLQNLLPVCMHLSWLSYGQSFGLDNPLVLNLGVLVITFALQIKITIASIIGVILAIIISDLFNLTAV